MATVLEVPQLQQLEYPVYALELTVIHQRPIWEHLKSWKPCESNGTGYHLSWRTVLFGSRNKTTTPGPPFEKACRHETYPRATNNSRPQLEDFEGRLQLRFTHDSHGQL